MNAKTLTAAATFFAFALTASAASAEFHYFTGVDSYGNDLAELQGATLQECEFTCLKVSRCLAFTYNVRHNACFLKSVPNSDPTMNGDAITAIWRTDSRSTPIKIRLR